MGPVGIKYKDPNADEGCDENLPFFHFEVRGGGAEEDSKQDHGEQLAAVNQVDSGEGGKNNCDSNEQIDEHVNNWELNQLFIEKTRILWSVFAVVLQYLIHDESVTQSEETVKQYYAKRIAEVVSGRLFIGFTLIVDIGCLISE